MYDDVRMAAKCGPDIIYLDGAEGGTGAGPHIATEETGIPLMAAIPEARRALEDVGLADEIDLVVAGGIRNGADVAKALALGAKAVAIGHSALMALNCNKEIPGVTDYEGTVGVPAGQCYHCHTGRCPVGVATQDPELRKRLVVEEASERVYNFLTAMTMELQMLARACGKTNVHSLEPEDLAALTVEASAMARVPLAGTTYTVGQTEHEILAEVQAPARDQGRGRARRRARRPTSPICGRSSSERAAASGGTSSRTPSPRRSSRSTPSSSPGTASRTRRTSRWSRTSTSMAATPGEDINWLEDIALLEEDGVPAVFDRYSNAFLKIYFPIPEGREDEIARKVLITHLTSRATRTASSSRSSTRSSPSPSSAPGSRARGRSARTGRPPVLEGWEKPAGH